jgi:hypothetical protein
MARSGHNGLIYVSGTELTAANAWSIDIEQANSPVPAFADDWTPKVVHQADWSGSITVWDLADSNTLQNAATAAASVALLIYPLRTDTSDYYSGNAIFGFSSSGDTGSAISNTASFVGDDTLTITGFS